jgi:hypothetical protein
VDRGRGILTVVTRSGTGLDTWRLDGGQLRDGEFYDQDGLRIDLGVATRSVLGCVVAESRKSVDRPCGLDVRLPSLAGMAPDPNTHPN